MLKVYDRRILTKRIEAVKCNKIKNTPAQGHAEEGASKAFWLRPLA
jgi:hypothetical protein